MPLTTTEAAARLGTTRQNVQKWCARHGVEKRGGMFWIDEATMERIKSRLGKPGREKKEEQRP